MDHIAASLAQGKSVGRGAGGLTHNSAKSTDHSTHVPLSTSLRLLRNIEALMLARRHKTTDHRRERRCSGQELAYGADAGRCAVWVEPCPYLHVMSTKTGIRGT